MADIALQVIYEIIASAIPIHHSIEGMCCAMSSYIVIMADLYSIEMFWAYYIGVVTPVCP